MRRLLTCLLLGLPLLASAQIYQYTDAKGNKVFTNQPPDGVATQPVQLPPINSVEPQAPTAAPTPAEAPTFIYHTLQLTDLPSDEALRANDGTFSVGVTVAPRLAAGHRLRLLLDGQPYGQPTRSQRLQLTNVDRGEHSLAVEVLKGEQSIQRSAAVTFTVQRISLNSPARSAPPPSPAP